LAGGALGAVGGAALGMPAGALGVIPGAVGGAVAGAEIGTVAGEKIGAKLSTLWNNMIRKLKFSFLGRSKKKSKSKSVDVNKAAAQLLAELRLWMKKRNKKSITINELIKSDSFNFNKTGNPFANPAAYEHILEVASPDKLGNYTFTGKELDSFVEKFVISSLTRNLSSIYQLPYAVRHDPELKKEVMDWHNKQKTVFAVKNLRTTKIIQTFYTEEAAETFVKKQSELGEIDLKIIPQTRKRKDMRDKYPFRASYFEYLADKKMKRWRNAQGAAAEPQNTASAAPEPVERQPVQPGLLEGRKVKYNRLKRQSRL
jgi:hypothetical protein